MTVDEGWRVPSRGGEDDPDESAWWELYEERRYRRWLRECPYEVDDWEEVLEVLAARERARLRYRRTLMDGVCLEGSHAVGAYHTVPVNPRYL